MTERSQLERLVKRVPNKYVKPPAQGKYGSYVPHEVINQILLAVCGPFDFKVEQVFYGPEGLVEGITASMTLTIDGRQVTVTEVGDCEQPKNWKTQGQRVKDAASDALKRCAMRFGCGLHLWCKDGEFFIHDQLSKDQGAGSDGKVGPPVVAPAPRGKHVATDHVPASASPFIEGML